MESNEVPRITCQELEQLIDKGEQLVVVDIRGGGYDSQHIKGAINISYDPSGDPMEREMTLTALPADKLMVIYCD
ncbi:MAG: rhodanese-like domain-containing protein [Dehalococcoidales bacterium]